MDHIRRRQVRQRLVITPVVVIGHEDGKSGFQNERYLVRVLTDVSLDSLVIIFELTVGMGVEGSGQDVIEVIYLPSLA